MMSPNAYPTKTAALKAAAAIAEQFPDLEAMAPKHEEAWFATLRVPAEFDPGALPAAQRKLTVLLYPDGTAFKAGKRGPVSASSRVEEQVLHLLLRKRGVTLEELGELYGWLTHSARSYLSVHSRKRGWDLKSKSTRRGRVFYIDAH